MNCEKIGRMRKGGREMARWSEMQTAYLCVDIGFNSIHCPCLITNCKWKQKVGCESNDSDSACQDSCRPDGSEIAHAWFKHGSVKPRVPRVCCVRSLQDLIQGLLKPTILATSRRSLSGTRTFLLDKRINAGNASERPELS